MRKLITLFVYYVFDALSNWKLTKVYREAKGAYKENGSGMQTRFTRYVDHWHKGADTRLLPIMSKKDVIAITERLDTESIYSWAYTGGSYGNPLRVPYSRTRDRIRTASFRLYNELAGFQLGDPYCLIRAKEKPGWQKFLRNEMIFIPKDISPGKLEGLITELKQRNIKFLMGYPTVIFEIALFLKNNPHLSQGLRVKSILTVSEQLDEYKREVIHQSFGCPIIDRYANEEVGLIAQQEEHGGRYLVNQFNIYVEVLDENSLSPVEVGSVGKVVVTDTSNDLLPLIRYDTGDLAIVDEYKDGRLYAISSIVGRSSEVILSTSNKPVSSLMLGPLIYKPLARQQIDCQFQLAYTANSTYELRFRKGLSSVFSRVKSEIVDGLKTVLGDDAVINVKVVDELNILSSGKCPIYINELE